MTYRSLGFDLQRVFLTFFLKLPVKKQRHSVTNFLNSVNKASIEAWNSPTKWEKHLAFVAIFLETNRRNLDTKQYWQDLITYSNQRERVNENVVNKIAEYFTLLVTSV